jgi:hypothetical protein
MKKHYITHHLVFGFLLLFIVAIINPHCGRAPYEATYTYRLDTLKFWRNKVVEYENETGQLPTNLFDVYLYLKEKGHAENIPLVVYKLFDHQKKKLNDEPELFHRFTDYEFIRKDQDWYIQENRVSGNILRIDSKGNINELEVKFIR